MSTLKRYISIQHPNRGLVGGIPIEGTSKILMISDCSPFVRIVDASDYKLEGDIHSDIGYLTLCLENMAALQRSLEIGVSIERIEELKARGYYVEDMGDEYGEEYQGQYRWMHNDMPDFQDDETSDNEADAWARCDARVRWLDRENS